MGIRNLVSRLPDGIRLELERKAIEQGFSGYEGLEAWVKAQGFSIGKSSLHRYFRKIEQREMAKLSAMHSVLIAGSAAASVIQQKQPLIVQIIDPVALMVSILPSQAAQADIEAAIRALS